MKNLLAGLVLRDLSPEQLTAVWRWSVTVVVAVFALLAVGKVPGFGGFVLTSEFAELKGKVDHIQISLLQQDLEQAQERVCKMIAIENREALRYAVEKRNELITQFRALTGDDPLLPTCDELGIGLPGPDAAALDLLLTEADRQNNAD